ncbi:MAG: hypothetical protein O3A59_08315, partial [Nitrospirae bacterium]|nr:hypothetical protein [Nitrospirota bacterium]
SGTPYPVNFGISDSSRMGLSNRLLIRLFLELGEEFLGLSTKAFFILAKVFMEELISQAGVKPKVS